MRTWVLLSALALLSGCSDSEKQERYQLTSSGDGKLYRLDKKTGGVALITPDGIRNVGPLEAQRPCTPADIGADFANWKANRDGKEDRKELDCARLSPKKTFKEWKAENDSNTDNAVETKKDVANENARRAQLYAVLSNSIPAQETKSKLTQGLIGKGEARTILEALIPMHLRPLPPSGESEDWSLRAKNYAGK